MTLSPRIHFFMSVLAFFILSGVLIYSAWILAKKNGKKQHFNKKKIIKGLTLFFFTYFLAFIIFRTGYTYIDGDFDYGSGFLGKFFELPLSLESALKFSASFNYGVFDFLWPNLSSNILKIYLLCAILVFVVTYSLWVMIQKKQFSLIRVAIILYASSLFLVNPQSFFFDVKFEVPAIHISELIEKKELGIFYNPVKFLNSNFKYWADFKEGELLLKSNLGKSFSIPLDELNQNLNGVAFDDFISAIKPSEHVSTQELKSDEVAWPSDFHCKNQVPTEGVAIGQKEEIKIGDVTDSNFCLRLLYKNDVVISNSLIHVMDARFSEDEKWAVLILNNDFSKPEDVYLLHLP